MTRLFIDRPVLAGVISILLVLLGAVAGVTLPVEQYPELAPPLVRVEALYPGASAQTIADAVAAPIEQEVNGVDRMLYMQSTSSDGRYALEVSFEPGVDVDLSAILVQNRVAIAEPKLPEEVRRQGVTTRKQSTNMVGVISLSSPDERHDDLFLANYLAINVKDEVARIYGVGGMNILPAKDYGMRVWLDPARLKARGLTVSDVVAAIRAQNVQVAGGAIGRAPAPAGTDYELTVTTQGRLTTAEEFARIIVKVGPDRSLVRVGDVARVELGTRDYSTVATFDGRPNAVLVVYQLPGANLVDVAASLEQKVKELEERLPPGLAVRFFYDSSMFIRASLWEVLRTLVEAFGLVFLVVLVFLRSFRTTLIPALTIPVSLVGTFLFLRLFGFSINTLTMFGLVLAIGIVVDDAIVVVENVERNLRERRLPPREATIQAMQEITGPVIAITLVLMSVFLPAAALAGITGSMFRQFALTIAASTGISALNALTLSPALCALLLSPHPGEHAPRGLLGRAGAAFERGFGGLTGAYLGLARLLARLWPLTLALFVGVMAATLALVRSVPTGFVPNEDLGFVVVAAQLPDGASLQRTEAVIAQVSSQVQAVDGVEHVVTLSGFSVLEGNGPTYGNAWIVLEPWEERAAKGRSAEAIMADIRTRLAPLMQSSFLVFSLPAIRGLGNTSGFDLRLQDRDAQGRAALQRSVDALLQAANSQSKLQYAFSSYREGVPQVWLDLDREKALKLGVPVTSVFDTLQGALGSAYVNDFNLFNRTYQVSVQADHPWRQRVEDVRRLEVRNQQGEMVPLGALVREGDAFGPERVLRYNMYPSANVIGVPAPGTSSGEALELMEQIMAAELPPGTGYEWSSLSWQEKQAGGQGSLAFALGLVLVYLILAAQYESFAAPVAVVLSVPLVIVGAMLALRWTGLDNNVFTQIGLVLLVGLGAKNAILIVEFARALRAAGRTPLEAAVEAARTRFRPILMTSLAFILGVLPLVVASGAGAASRRALGTAVFGGMLGATVLGLLFTPALWLVVERAAAWLAPRRPAPRAGKDSGILGALRASAAALLGPELQRALAEREAAQRAAAAPPAPTSPAEPGIVGPPPERHP